MAHRRAILKAIPIFSTLDEQHLKELSQFAYEKKYRKDQVIFDQGDQGDFMFVIRSGLVKISLVDSTNHELILQILSDNDFFGEVSVLDGKERSATATAIEPTQVLIIHQKDLLHIIEHIPSVALSIMIALAQNLRSFTASLSNLNFFDAYGKVARCLLDLAQKNGITEGEHTVINLRVSRQELASMAGLSRESFSRILKEFQTRGTIHIQGKQIIIANQKLLSKEIHL